MKKIFFLILLVLLTVLVFTNVVIAEESETIVCTDEMKVCPDGSDAGRIPGTCDFEPCPGEECVDPYVLFEGACVDPAPPCLNPPENAMFCIDKIENGERIERFDVICYDEWNLVDGECVNPCDDPYIPIDGQCVDPIPACENPPLNSVPSSCVDKIHLDGSISLNFTFSCLDGYESDGFSCVSVEPVFSDIDGYGYRSAVEYVEENGIVSGYDDGTYKPDYSINRAEFTKIIVGALYSSDDFEDFADDDCFSDVFPGEWFTKYVCFAKEEGIINGYPDNTFKSADNINYVEALKIVLEAYTQKGLMENVDSLYGYVPIPLPWYQNYLSFANDEELSFSGDVENDQLVTRGETAEIIKWIDGVTE